MSLKIFLFNKKKIWVNADQSINTLINMRIQILIMKKVCENQQHMFRWLVKIYKFFKSEQNYFYTCIQISKGKCQTPLIFVHIFTK